MLKIKVVKLIIALAICQIAEGVLTYTTPTTQFCRRQGIAQTSATDVTSANLVYHYTSTFTAPEYNNETVPIFVKSADGTNDFTFKSMTSDWSLKTERKCLGSSQYFFIALLNSYLFLKYQTDYYVCRYNANSDSTPVLLSQLGIPTPVNNFVPYFVNDTAIFVLASDNVGSRVVTYKWAEAGPLTGTIDVGATPNVFTEAAGTESFLLNRLDNYFYVPNSTKTGWIKATGVLPNTTAANTVQKYILKDSNVVLKLSYGPTNSAAYLVKGSTVTTLYTTVNSPIFVHQLYSDNIYNFVRVHQVQMFWFTLSKNTATNLISRMSKTQNANLPNIVSVGLSRNKATIFYSTGRVQYLRHVASGNIAVLFNNTATSTIDWTTTKQYSIALNCVCNQLKKMNCFSATLSCVITTKAATTCNGSGDDPSLSW